MELALLDHFQFIELLDFFEFLIDDQFSDGLHLRFILRKGRIVIHHFICFAPDSLIAYIAEIVPYLFLANAEPFRFIVFLPANFLLEILYPGNIYP